MRVGDHPGPEVGVAEPRLDERLHAKQQGPLAGVRRHPLGTVEPRRQRDGEQVDHGRAEPDAVRSGPPVEMPDQLAHQRPYRLVEVRPTDGVPHGIRRPRPSRW